MGAGASASAQGSQRGGSSVAGDSEGEGETSIGSTATKTTLPGQTKAVMKDMENMRKLMSAKDEKERALTQENNELKKRVGQLEEKLTQMFAALKLMKVQASENAKRLSDAEEQILTIGAPEREVHVQRFAREQLQVEYEEFKVKVAEQQQRYERDIRLAQSNLTTRAGADGSTKESMREQLLSLRATVADLRATNSKLMVENAAQAAKLASIESGAPITDMEVGDFDSPFFRGAPKSKISKSRDNMGNSQASSALPSARSHDADQSRDLDNDDSLLNSDVLAAQRAAAAAAAATAAAASSSSPVRGRTPAQPSLAQHDATQIHTAAPNLAPSIEHTSSAITATPAPAPAPAPPVVVLPLTLSNVAKQSSHDKKAGPKSRGSETSRSGYSLASSQRLPMPLSLEEAMAHVREVLPAGYGPGGELCQLSVEGEDDDVDVQRTMCDVLFPPTATQLRSDLVRHLSQACSTSAFGCSIILGGVGFGKTCVMISLVRELELTGVVVIPILIRSTPSTTSVRLIAKHLVKHLRSHVPPQQQRDVPEIINDCAIEVDRYCRLLRSSRKKVVVVIDDLDVLYDSHRPTMIEWLPGAVASNLYLCCSLKDERSINVIRRYVEINFEIELDVLTQDQKVMFIHSWVRERRRWLVTLLQEQHSRAQQEAMEKWKRDQDARETRRLQRERLRGETKRGSATTKELPASLKALLDSEAVGETEQIPEAVDEVLQAYELESFLDKDDSVNVAYLSIAMRHIGSPHRTSTMMETVGEMPPRTDVLCSMFLQQLEQRHGASLTFCVLCLLETARAGLSEAELLAAALLPERSPDPALPGKLGPCLGTVSTEQWHAFLADLQPLLRPVPKRKLPAYAQRWEWQGQGSVPLVLADGAIVAASQQRYREHKCFWHRIPASRQANRRLAVFFRSLIAKGPPDESTMTKEEFQEALYQYRHAFKDTVHHLIETGEWRVVEVALTDLLYIRAKSAALSVYHLLQDYTDAIEKGAAASEEEQNKGLTYMQRTRLLDFMHFIEQNMTLFSKYPLLLLQSAANGPDASYVTRSALKLVDDQMTTFGWFKFLNKSNSTDPCVLTIGSAGAAVSCFFTPDSKKIALGCIDGFGGRATVYDAYTGAALNSHTLSANPKIVTYNSDGRVLMVMTNDGCCILYDTVNNKERIRGFISNTDITCAALSLDGTKVFAATKKGEMSVWDGRDQVFFKLFETKDTDDEGRVCLIVCMCLHPTMKVLFLGLGDGNIRAYRFTLFEGFRRAATLKFHTTRVTAVVLSTNAAYLLSGSVDCSLAVWSVPDEMLELPMYGFGVDTEGKDIVLEDAGHLMMPGVTVSETVAISAVCFSQDGARFAAAFDDGVVKLYLSETGEFVLKLGPHNAAVNSLQFAPSGKFVVSASGDCTTKFWSVGVQDTDEAYTGHKNTRVLHLSYSIEGAEVASAALDGSIYLWSAKRGTEMAAFEGHSDEITGIVISSKDQTVITQCAIDGTIRRWSTLSGSELRDKRTTSIFVCSFAQSVSGDYIVSGGFDGSLSVWRVTDGQAHMRLGVEVTELDGVFLEKIVSVHNDAISCCCWSPNDDRIASGSHDGSVKVWNAQWANCTHTFESKIGHQGSVNRVQFHQSGRFLASCGTEGKICFWNLSSSSLHLYAFLHSYDHYFSNLSSLISIIRCISDHRGSPVNCIGFNVTGKYLFSVSEDCSLRAWSVELSLSAPTYEEVAMFAIEEPVSALAVSPITSEDEVTIGTESGRIYMLQLLMPGEW